MYDKTKATVNGCCSWLRDAKVKGLKTNKTLKDAKLPEAGVHKVTMIILHVVVLSCRCKRQV